MKQVEKIMLTEDERERLELMEAFTYACTGQNIHLVKVCESWLVNGNAALHASRKGCAVCIAPN